MDDNQILEWFAPRLPFSVFVLSREGKRAAMAFAAFCLGGCLLGGLILAWENENPAIILYMILLGAALLFLGVASVLVVFLGLWLLGYGYSYRLGPHTLAYRFVGGKGKPPRTPSPDERRTGAWLGGKLGFGGWAAWEWLRERAVRIEPIEERNLVVLRSAGGEKWHERKVPAIYLFCRDRARFAAVLNFVGEKLADPASRGGTSVRD